MKEIELYDIITLRDNSEYAVLQMLYNEEDKYYLLAPVDEDEEPDMENIKIVKEIKIDNRIIITEEIEEKKLKELSKIFLNLLKKELD